ncbi:MAG: hypothetical protein Q7J04_01400, partial [Microcella sp.]|nr:hypothetical protein [Microcella sp.]
MNKFPLLASRPLRLAAGCQFRGSDDSLPLVVANLVSLGFDLILLVDHLNDSIPLALLQRLTHGRAELRVIRKQTPRYAQSGVQSLLMQIAHESGAHAYLHVDADELPDDTFSGPPFRQVVKTWLEASDTAALVIPRENYLQQRSVERWGWQTLDAPNHRVLGPSSTTQVHEAGFFGRTPHVRVLARLTTRGKPSGAENEGQWVRWGSHRLYGRPAELPDGQLSMEVSPHVVIRHLPYPSRESLVARLAFRTREDGSVRDNRGNSSIEWASVSVPTHPDDPHPGPAVRTTHDDAFARIRDRIASAGIAHLLADPMAASDRTVLTPTAADEIFASA